MAHSLGGGVAQCFSATFPERVIRLVSIGMYPNTANSISNNAKSPPVECLKCGTHAEDGMNHLLTFV